MERPGMVALTTLLTRRALAAAARALVGPGGHVSALIATSVLVRTLGACGERLRVYWAQDAFVGGAGLFGPRWGGARGARGGGGCGSTGRRTTSSAAPCCSGPRRGASGRVRSGWRPRPGGSSPPTPPRARGGGRAGGRGGRAP